jgi:hypothetical protein
VGDASELLVQFRAIVQMVARERDPSATKAQLA